MKINEFKRLLADNPGVPFRMILPDGELVPLHFHVTEVGRVVKSFVDCGGTRRRSATALLQVWVADDVDHRLTTTRLAKILDLAVPILGKKDLTVEVEYQTGTVSQYSARASVAPSGKVVLIELVAKKTACLAPDKCGVKLFCSGGKCS